MFDRLYRKLAGVLLVLLLAFAAVGVGITLATTRAYSEAAQQWLYRDLAGQIVTQELLTEQGEVRREALEEVFHTLMVVNPSLELYLLDREGRILDYSAPPGRVHRSRVSLEPIRALLEGRETLPILGDDPRARVRRKIFSVAPLEAAGRTAGYLYVILESEEEDAAFRQVAGSPILRLALWALALSLLSSLLAGLWLFRLLTRRLRRLSTAMKAFEASGFTAAPEPGQTPPAGPRGDEIDQLQGAFHRMAERIVRQIGELRRMDASRRELVAQVSHDLRTPLAHMQGYLDTLQLKEESLSEDERRECLEIALRQTEQLGRLVDELFELAKLDAGTAELRGERISLTELAQDAVQELQLAARDSGIELELDLPRAPAFVHADPSRIQRVLDNLLDNALRCTPRGGRITVSVRAETDRVTLRVTDTGKGIPPEELPHVFDRFYRRGEGPSPGGGAGLGLTIAQRIVDLHGGEIHCRSRVGEGTELTVTLPV